MDLGLTPTLDSPLCFVHIYPDFLKIFSSLLTLRPDYLTLLRRYRLPILAHHSSPTQCTTSWRHPLTSAAVFPPAHIPPGLGQYFVLHRLPAHTTFDMTLIATRLSTGPRLYSTKRGPGEYISASMLPRFLMESPSPHARPTVHQVIASYTLRPSVYACPSQPLYPCATTYISSPDLYIP
jgi:hypothetical protein